jgi:hypothetical protein
MTAARVLLLPGWQNSGPGHWQSRWQVQHGFQRVQQDDWLWPRRGDWMAVLEDTLLADDRPAYLFEPSSAAAADGVAALVEHLSAEGVDAAPTIEGCGTATQEDWCVMVREDTWRLSAACVCFPSQWALTAKAGGTVAEIHAPVPGYEQDLGGLVESFFDRLGAGRTVWRTNWNLWDDPRLAQPWSEADAPENSATKAAAPPACGMRPMPWERKCARSCGVTMPPSHGPQLMERTRQVSPRRWASAWATLLRTSLAIA